MIKTEDDDRFLSGLLDEVDSNIPAPAPRLLKSKTAERRKARALSPAPDTRQPAAKKVKIADDRAAPLTPSVDEDDDAFIPMNDDDPLPTEDVPMSDPAPSSPTAKAVDRKAKVKAEAEEEEDDMMEVAHAGAINAASVNLSATRQIKKIIKPDPYPSPANSSPVKAADGTVDSSSWNEITQKLNVVSSSPAEARTIGKIDYKDAIEDDGSLNFFWTDYTEANGSLCLFGKVLNKKTETYVSCFVKVDNILRKLFFLPRQHRLEDGEEASDEVEMMDVYSEVDAIMSKMNVSMYKIKACTRKYAFELPDIPKEAQYLKLFYPYSSKFP